MFREFDNALYPAPLFLSELVAHHGGWPIVAIALKGYYDGTGSPPSKNRGQIIGLGGYAASPSVWDEFEAEWWRVLADDTSRPACQHLHMVDANALQGEFLPERGWTKQAVDRLLSDIFNRCFSPRGIGCELPHALVGAACTVDMDAYRRVCEQHPHFIEKAPEALCVDHVVTVAIQQLVPPGIPGMDMNDLLKQRRSIEIFFDRNEPYRHHIQRVWDALPWHKQPLALRFVHAIGMAYRESSAAIQAADFLAWHANRDVASESGSLAARMMVGLASRCAMRHYGYDELLATAARWRQQGGYDAVPE